jgi:hypothetical protein
MPVASGASTAITVISFKSYNFTFQAFHFDAMFTKFHPNILERVSIQVPAQKHRYITFLCSGTLLIIVLVLGVILQQIQLVSL